MKIWFKCYQDARLLWAETIENTKEDTRTHKVFDAMDQICYQYDLGKPIWLNANVEEFQKRAKTRFTQDNFVEEISFDFLEMQILEEDA